MGVNGKQDETRNIIFQRKTRKNGNKHEKQERKKQKQKKPENYKKYRNEAIQDFGETRFPRDEISTRFREMLKTETRTKTRSAQIREQKQGLGAGLALATLGPGYPRAGGEGQ